ncbi:MAG: TIGR01458 family HAD-type hydrolase [Aquificaceae bacterium]|jgi:HAD superfamily hydrolase (TIGR01458 family)|uniref:TIGR01458 family HAD-type hydrolase n=1 Tax=Hydrogenobacter sp. Uz 6-8 TaxID=3384828 RepID=UPI000F1E04C4|nr:MAG: TIGR01458 family HAD-type hydrolase [Aquificota bacterium]
MVKAVLFDIDGVLCIRDRLIEGAPEAFERIKKHFRVALVTNTTRVSSRTTFTRLRSLGFKVEEEELYTALRVSRIFLSKNSASAFILATDEVMEEFRGLEVYPLKYVLVADAYKSFTYENLNTAFRLLLEGKELLVSAPNRYFMDTDGKLSLDAGPFCKALEYASGKSARVLGKPSEDFFRIVLEKLDVSSEEALMVGDDIEYDVLGAQRLGMKGCLVKTGKFRPEDLTKGKPDFLIDSVRDLPRLLGL